MLELLILAIIAGLIFSKLFKILGSTDDDAPRYRDLDPIIEQLKRKNEADAQQADIEIVSAIEAALPEQVRLVCDKIRTMDPSFRMDTFYQGVRKAFQMIIEAFVKGDEDVLKRLLNKEVLEHFSKDIAKRKATNRILEKIIVGINNVEAVSASMDGTSTTIGVKIISDQITVVKDHLGNVLDGHPTRAVTVNDLWTFSRDLRKDKIWMLVSTG